ncbi:hypothetical protein J6590_046356 [Homalodisca vitripennis]|nr:hypothetical protein J6590_046356 [Homalodisca vitripennis]
MRHLNVDGSTADHRIKLRSTAAHRTSPQHDLALQVSFFPPSPINVTGSRGGARVTCLPSLGGGISLTAHISRIVLVVPIVLNNNSGAQKNDKDWTVQRRLLSARRASQMAVFDNEIERWGEVDVLYLPSQLIGTRDSSCPARYSPTQVSRDRRCLARYSTIRHEWDRRCHGRPLRGN